MNLCWGGGVVTREDVSCEDRQWKRLIAGSIKVAARNLAIFGKGMIDFGDKAVNIVGSGRGHEHICTTRISRIERSIRGWPRISRQETGNNWIAWSSKIRYLGWIGNTCSGIQPNSFTLAFIREVKEGPVAFYRTAERSSKLIVSECSLWIWFRVENIASIKLVVSEEDRKSTR